ncbi:MAG: N-acetylmuramoyl-L-alanine amidase, partial [Synechococcales cyanobacterium T60_A2020_003]|nr:N-acetylmuramoyl-L-alanine amidase [Synechococcales cyanobacterium T60_A2020_003]
LHQAGQRLIEVIASDEEKDQIVLTVEPITQSLQVFPFSIWTTTPTPSSIPDLVNPKRITLHHTVIAALSSGATQDQEIQRMRRLLDIHLNSSGYSDIGYHYIVMPSGRVYEGRSSLKRGAHDLVNDGFGVAVDGDFQGSLRIGPKQFDAVVGICIMLCKRMGITDPVTPVSTVTADFGTRSLPRIMGHRDRVSTACPGTVYERLNEIRQAVRDGLR